MAGKRSHIGPSVEHVCALPSCGRSFSIPMREVRRGRGECCSLACANGLRSMRQHVAKPRLGAANPNFRGGGYRSTPRVYVDRFRAKYPEKAHAHDELKKAMERGEIIRPLHCQRCGTKADVQAHHTNYAAPLSVVFVCRPCHRVVDRQRRLAVSLGWSACRSACVPTSNDAVRAFQNDFESCDGERREAFTLRQLREIDDFIEEKLARPARVELAAFGSGGTRL